MKMLPKPVIVLRLLLAGQPVELDVWNNETKEVCHIQDGKFYIESMSYVRGKEPESILLAIHMDLDWFIQTCELLSEEECFIMNANKVLQDWNRKDRQ
jgi:hypothetical protein